MSDFSLILVLQIKTSVNRNKTCVTCKFKCIIHSTTHLSHAEGKQHQHRYLSCKSLGRSHTYLRSYMDVCPGIRISWDRGTHDVADAIHKSPLAPCQLYGGNGSERSYFLCNSIHFSKEKSDASKRGWIRWAHSFSSPLTMWMFISWQFRQIALLQLIYR